MEKILDIIEAIAHEKNISKEHAIEAFKDALKTYKQELPDFFKEIQGKDFLVKALWLKGLKKRNN